MITLTFTLAKSAPATAHINPAYYYDVDINGHPFLDNFVRVGSALPKYRVVLPFDPLFRQIVRYWLKRAIPDFNGEESKMQMAMELLKKNSPDDVLNLLRMLN